MTLTLVRKSLATLIREVLEAKGVPVLTDVRDGRLLYCIDGTWLTPGKAAEALGVVWP